MAAIPRHLSPSDAIGPRLATMTSLVTVFAVCALWAWPKVRAQEVAAPSPAEDEQGPTLPHLPVRSVRCVFTHQIGAPRHPATCYAEHVTATHARITGQCRGVDECTLTAPAYPGTRYWSPDSTTQPLWVHPTGPITLKFALLRRSVSTLKGPWLSGVTRSSAWIRWETNTTARSWIRISSPAGPGPQITPRWVEGHSTCQQGSCVHSVRVAQLPAGRRVAFLVGDVQPSPSTGQHPWGLFSTPSSTRESSFSVLGDVQGGNQLAWKHISSTMAALQKYPGGAVFHTGDMTAAPEYAENWQNFFSNGSTMLSRHPFYPAIGNNDDEAGFKKYFGRQADGNSPLYYSIDHGRTHFIVLKNHAPDEGLCKTPSDQTNWLLRDLADIALRDREIDHVVLITHWGPRGFGGYGDAEKLKICLESLFVDPNGRATSLFKKLRLVISGHQHYYQRIEREHVAGGLRRKIHYVTVGSAGASTTGRCPPSPHDPSVKAESPCIGNDDPDYAGSVIDVNDQVMNLRAYSFSYGADGKWGRATLDCVHFDANGNAIQIPKACPP